MGADQISEAMARGGPVMWAIVAMGAVALAVMVWKATRLAAFGAWGGTDVGPAVSAWAAGDQIGAEALLKGARGVRGRMARVAMTLRRDPRLGDAAAREEVTRLALAELREARAGLRVLDGIVTLAPLVGLFGTVLGMVGVFSAAGAGGDEVAGVFHGLGVASLTTAAGIGVAIPSALAVAWFDAVIERIQADLEDVASVIFTRAPQGGR